MNPASPISNFDTGCAITLPICRTTNDWIGAGTAPAYVPNYQVRAPRGSPWLRERCLDWCCYVLEIGASWEKCEGEPKGLVSKRRVGRQVCEGWPFFFQLPVRKTRMHTIGVTNKYFSAKVCFESYECKF